MPPNPAPPFLPPAVLRVQRSDSGWDNKGKGKQKQPMDPAIVKVSLAIQSKTDEIARSLPTNLEIELTPCTCRPS